MPAPRWRLDGQLALVTGGSAGIGRAIVRELLGFGARVLVAGGRLVFSLDHPLRDCFFDATEHELSVYPARSYFDSSPLLWRFTNPGVWMHTHHHTVGEWVDLLGQAGFRLQRLLEPVPPRKLLDALWPLLRPGGRLLYCTCSVLKDENERQVAGFLARTPTMQAAPLDACYGHESGDGRQRFPGEDGMDGFFYALMTRRG